MKKVLIKSVDAILLLAGNHSRAAISGGDGLNILVADAGEGRS